MNDKTHACVVYGANGNLGRSIVSHLSSFQILQVYAISRRTPIVSERTAGVLYLSCKDGVGACANKISELIGSSEKCVTVINCAGYYCVETQSSIQADSSLIRKAISSNICAAMAAAELSALLGARLMVHLSTYAVCCGFSGIEDHDRDRKGRRSIYSRTKKKAELRLLNKNLDVLILRLPAVKRVKNVKNKISKLTRVLPLIVLPQSVWGLRKSVLDVNVLCNHLSSVVLSEKHVSGGVFRIPGEEIISMRLEIEAIKRESRFPVIVVLGEQYIPLRRIVAWLIARKAKVLRIWGSRIASTLQNSDKCCSEIPLHSIHEES